MYVLGGAGKADMSIEQGRFDAAAAAAGIAPSSSSNTRTTGWKAGIGYQFSSTLGVEASYVNFGKTIHYSNPSATTTGVNFRPTSINLFAVPMVPLSNTVGVFGKAGVAYTRVRADIEETTFTRNSATKINIAWGFGLESKFSDGLSLRVEYERFGEAGNTLSFNPNSGTGTGTLSLLSAGLVYRF